MKQHQISQFDLSDTFLLYYGAGSMGDFLSSLLLFSFNKKFNRSQQSAGPDSFYYEPWSKKWVTRDSSTNQFRNFLYKRSQASEAKTPIMEMVQEYQNTELEFRGVKDIGLNYHLDSTLANPQCELAIVLRLIGSIRKDEQVPYLFVSENLADYFRYSVKQQDLPNLSFIEAGFSEQKFYPLYFILSLYKNKLHYNNQSAEDFSRGRTAFIEEAMHILKHGRNFAVNSQLINHRQYVYIDTLKLILDYDTQGLEVLDNTNIQLRNMIDLARRDMFDILEFFELDLHNLPEFDEDRIAALYDRMRIIL